MRFRSGWAPQTTPSPRACSLGPRGTPPPRHGPRGAEGAGLGQQPLPPSSGTLGRRQGWLCMGAAPPCWLGLGAPSRLPTTANTQELHASRAFTGPADPPPGKRNTRAAKGQDEHSAPSAPERTGLLRHGRGRGLNLGSWACQARPLRRFPLARASVSLPTGQARLGGAFWAGGGPRVSGTRLAGDPCLASPPSPIAARGSSPRAEETLGL